MTDQTPGLRLNLRTALVDGVRDMPRMWRGAWAVLALAFAVGLVALWFGPHQVAGQVAWLAVGLLTLMAITALARLGVRSDEAGVGPGGLQFGGSELRVAAAFLLNLVFVGMILSVLALFVLAIAGAAGLGDAIELGKDVAIQAPSGDIPAWRLWVTGAIALGALTALLLLIARLSLFAQATVAHRAVVSVRTMAMTRGAGWKLLAGILITETPKMALIAAGALGWLPGHVAAVAWAVVLVWVQAPLTAGFFGAAWRQIHG